MIRIMRNVGGAGTIEFHIFIHHKPSIYVTFEGKVGVYSNLTWKRFVELDDDADDWEQVL